MAAALSKHIADPGSEADNPARADLVARYRRVRAISTEIQQAAVNLVSEDALLQRAGRLGVRAPGKGLYLEHPNIMSYIGDLLVYTAPAGRSRAIDRLARSAPYAPGSEESRVLKAMQKARFTVIKVDRRHDIAGVIGQELISGRDIWIVDLGMEQRWPKHMGLALRLFEPAEFHVTTGVAVPMDAGVLVGMMVDGKGLKANSPQALVEDRRFAEKLYRIALESGALDSVELRKL